MRAIARESTRASTRARCAARCRAARARRARARRGERAKDDDDGATTATTTRWTRADARSSARPRRGDARARVRRGRLAGVARDVSGARAGGGEGAREREREGERDANATETAGTAMMFDAYRLAERVLELDVAIEAPGAVGVGGGGRGGDDGGVAVRDEAHVSAEQLGAKAKARVQGAITHGGGEKGAGATAKER